MLSNKLMLDLLNKIRDDGTPIFLVESGHLHAHGGDIDVPPTNMIVISYLGWRYRFTQIGIIGINHQYDTWHCCIADNPLYHERISLKLGKDELGYSNMHEIIDTLMIIRKEEFERRKRKYDDPKAICTL